MATKAIRVLKTPLYVMGLIGIRPLLTTFMESSMKGEITIRTKKFQLSQ
jgi:hypothetical protein